MSFRLDNDLAYRLRIQAARECCQQQDIVADAIAAYLDAHEQDPVVRPPKLKPRRQRKSSASPW